MVQVADQYCGTMPTDYRLVSQMDEPKREPPQAEKIHFQPFVKTSEGGTDVARAFESGPYVNASKFGDYAPLTLLLTASPYFNEKRNHVTVIFHVKHDPDHCERFGVGGGASPSLKDCFNKIDFHKLGIAPSDLKTGTE